MDKIWTFYSSVILLSVIQIQHVLATVCDIVSVTSPSASTLQVEWNSHPNATVYQLDFKAVNSTNVATVVVTQSAPSTQRLVQGLKPGHVYEVKLTVLNFFSAVCTDTETAMTVPATSQITFSKAISSTSITFEWSKVTGADSYILFVEQLFVSPAVIYNKTFTTQTGQFDGLTPSTTYSCFIHSVNSAGRGAKSNVKTIMTLVQPPTGVAIQSTGRSTARVTWNSVSLVLLYQVTVSDDNPDNPPVIRNSSTTSLDISNLEPCSNYTVGVSSLNMFLVPGEASNVTHSTVTINPVTTVSVDYSCSGGLVTVTWDLVFGANLYRATAVDGTGESLNCTSASSSCQITMLKCGEKYSVHVTAISDDCESKSNVTRLFDTVPCAPADLQTLHDCSGNVIVFSWQATNNTRFYVATAVDNTGVATECRTLGNQCYFTNTDCGQYYRFTVYAVSYECNSEESRAEFVRTAPCLPTNVRTSPTCNADTLITMWDAAAGALSYTVEAEGNTGKTYNCTTSSTSCAVQGVPCGEHLSVWIIASNDNCSTERVLGQVAQTVPCTPTNVSAFTDCSPDSVRMNWTESIGSVFYIAVAEDTTGNIHSCNSMSSNCLIEGLTCGQNYTGSVTGTNMHCNSTVSNEVAFMTAPCPPTNIEATTDCEANHALIVWQKDQSTGLYTATIDDQSGDQLNCTSDTVNYCMINSLPCGKLYNVTVTYSDGQCPATSMPISLASMPCVPEDVMASVACVTGELTVTWNSSTPTQNYTTIISRGMGQPIYCNSTEPQCSTGGLLCGSNYRVTVFSVAGQCFSQPSTEVTVKALPCPPTSITANHTCAPDPVPVSWVASASAKYYTAVATSSGGHRSECSTNATSCSLPWLQCGEVYTISVSGADDRCAGQPSNIVSLNTEPCAPSNVSSQLMCSSGTAQVFWAPSANAVMYSVKATTNEHTLSCSSYSSNCTLTDLVCGKAYDIRVTATDGTCISNFSDPLSQDQVPCPPQSISANMLCGTNDILVSWVLSPEPFNYTVTAMPLSGNTSSVSCHTDKSNCSLSGLQCGWAYNVSVKASSDSCSGPYSSPQTVQTAPCSPSSLTAHTGCGLSLVASWDAAVGATNYTTSVTGPNGFSDNCYTSGLTCSFSGLQCATQYTVTVTSQDSHCPGAPSQTVITTGPCDPVNVTSSLHCGSDMATVSWSAAAGAVAYTVVAQEDTSHYYISCRSNTTSCQLNQLQCGKAYNLTVMAEDETCNSTGSTRTVMMTAPCSPSVQNSSQICGTNSSSLSWTTMAYATGYMVNATATSGHRVWCSSSTATCTLTDLMCSENYTATVIAQGNQCNSPPGSSSTFTTAPCSPVITSKQYMCGANTAVFSWTEPAESLSFQAQLVGEGYQDSCQTTNTSCMFSNLPCGLDFNVTVQAQGAQCNSIPSLSESVATEPCSPQNVSATLVCSNYSAVVMWVGSPSAEAYNVTATAQDGHTHHCHTNTTSCRVSDIHCGETYAITVTPYSTMCAGNPSAVYTFRAGLCAPSNVTVSSACEDSVVSWSPVTGADMHIATATADDGHSQTCRSNYSNWCNFTNLHCGETYSVTVVTVDRGCWSEPSSATVLRTALCPPTNLTGQVNCGTNSLALMWDQSPVSGVTYALQTEMIGSMLPPSVYTTSNTSHTLTNLMCGNRYAFQIAAQDGNCRSSFSPPIEISTAPCQPTNFTAHVDCGTNKGNFSWVESIGAGFYTVEVTGEHGHIASCSSNDTSCAVKLHCGRSYSATLVASTESCNSTEHADIHFDSAPCLPDDVVAEVECSTNVMNVSWSQTPGSDDYTAWAISTDGHRASCNSTSNSCSIHDLQCGKVYEVAVTSSSIHCTIIAGSDYKIQSAPCRAENVMVNQNCSSSNVLTVTWDQRSTTQNYTVKASAPSGVNSTCDTVENSCTFLDLSCGQLYTFTVMGYTNVCMSDISTLTDILTAPCPPSNVSAVMNCTTHAALVKWSTAAAATGYSVQATTTDGHNSSCSEMGTYCNLHNLLCGEEYSVVVEAMHTGCPGPASAPIWLTTEPCVPTNLSVHYNMSTALVMWGTARGASSYSVEAVTDQGPTVACNTNNNNCFLNDLQCSHIYNVTVTAHNQTCDSLTSEAQSLMTEPCPPTNVQVSMECEQLTATVSWDHSVMAVGYVAYFNNQNGHYTYCTATDTQCSVSGLMCGTVYSVWVKALGQQYNSSDSAVVSLTSGPCEPSSIEAIMDCEAHSVIISWQPSTGAALYIAELTASSGHITSCTTNYTNCQQSSLQCGEFYNVTVTAVGENCNSTAQMAEYLTTEPCVPTNLSVHYNVSTAQVMWSAAGGASSYSVEAVTDQGLMVTCNTTQTSCLLRGLQCSQIYNVTVMAQNLACNNTVTSAPYWLMTEPCPPSNVQANMMCEQLMSTVSWEQSDLAVGYVAYFNNQNGHYTYCTATDTQCSVSGLMCGTVYSVWVKALGQQYNSSDSAVVSLTSAPCLPREVEVEVNCNSDGAAVVSWNATSGTANFSLTAIVSGSLQTLCTTQQNMCNVTSLTCGETYNLSLTATNAQCSLTAPTHANLTTRPCPPVGVAVDLQCGSRTAVLTWEQRSDVELYVATAIMSSGGEVRTCNSTGSGCRFASLACGEMFNFTVTAHSQSCSSQPSNAVTTETAPCQPVIVSAQALCQSEQVQISWNQVGSVVNHLVTAMGSLGYVQMYNTTQTLLSATLPCGQDYNVTVQGQGSECDSLPSSPAYLKTSPCIPRDLITYVQCESNIGSVSWGASDGAESYIAAATGRDGHTHECLTNTTSCTWNDLHCGEDYTVVVSAKDGNCTSLLSNSSVIHMDPCVLQDVVASVYCDMRVVSLSWNASEGAQSYVVHAEAGSTTTGLTTNDTTGSFSDFTCGQNYSLTVTPHSQHCSGSSSTPATVQTWPCPPSGVSTLQDCLSGITMVTWQTSNGSDYYTATAQTDSGISGVCMSDSDGCSFPGLTCGYNFSVTVTASNQQCTIPADHSVRVQSGPCIPTNISAEMDCGNNTAVVSWLPSRGAVQYLVMAHSSHNNVSCQTSDLSCRLDSLMCGSCYSIQIVSMDDNCSSAPSQPLMLYSAPCPPHNVSTQLGCSSDDLMISWDAVREADYFWASVMAENGAVIDMCNTTSTACSISNVSCGRTFTVQVYSARGDCISQHSQTHTVMSAPCQPQGVTGYIDCVTNSAWISWDAAAGAESYTVSALGGDDYMANCTTSANTTCAVEDLACGVLYNFSVVAKNSHCESQPSAIIDLQTAPCSLSGITAISQCHNSSILVIWELMEGGNGNTVYTATAEASDRTYLSCNNTGSSCYLYGARCGLHYTVMVAASSDQCNSMRSPPYRISMEPCPPSNVMANMSCEDQSALVSWSPSPVAETYHVVAMGADGHVHTCNTTSSNCSVSELHCEEQYTVFVSASHENCTSMHSENITLNTGPCKPSGLSVLFNCNTQSAQLTWTPRDNAVDYYGCGQSGDGAMLYCHSTSPTCTIEGLDCGTVYNFSVQASNGQCNSSFSDPVQDGAVPCPPDSIDVQLLPMQMEVQVLHFNWSEVACSDTEYLLTLTGSLLGDNQTLFNLQSYWTNRTYFEFPLPCSSSYKATVQSRNSAGTSPASMPLYGETAPCPPLGVEYSGNSTFATISWNASVFATTYTVFDNSVTPRVQLCSVSGLSCSLSNIASSNLVITASSAAGESEATSITTVLPQGRRRRDVEMQNGLSAPVLDVSQPMSTVIFVQWSEVDGASLYSLVIRKQDRSSEPQELTVYGESIILSDLSLNSTYCFSVSASNSDITGPESEPVCVQTGQGLTQ